MDDDWDSELANNVNESNAGAGDRWDGEDEDDVKDCWEDSDEEDENKASSKPATPVHNTNISKKKKLEMLIAEKEKKKQEEIERRKKEREEEEKAQTPEQMTAEKLRIQKVQMDSDFEIASDLMGVSTKKITEGSLDSFSLSTAEGLEDFLSAFSNKVKSIDRLEKKPHFVRFIEDFNRRFSENMELDDLKRVSTVLTAVYNEKLKASKSTKTKKSKAKAKLNTVDDPLQSSNYTYHDDYDDFI